MKCTLWDIGDTCLFTRILLPLTLLFASILCTQGGKGGGRLCRQGNEGAERRLERHTQGKGNGSMFVAGHVCWWSWLWLLIICNINDCSWVMFVDGHPCGLLCFWLIMFEAGWSCLLLVILAAGHTCLCSYLWLIMMDKDTMQLDPIWKALTDLCISLNTVFRGGHVLHPEFAVHASAHSPFTRQSTMLLTPPTGYMELS